MLPLLPSAIVPSVSSPFCPVAAAGTHHSAQHVLPFFTFWPLSGIIQVCITLSSSSASEHSHLPSFTALCRSLYHPAFELLVLNMADCRHGSCLVTSRDFTVSNHVDGSTGIPMLLLCVQNDTLPMELNGCPVFYIYFDICCCR